MKLKNIAFFALSLLVVFPAALAYRHESGYAPESYGYGAGKMYNAENRMHHGIRHGGVISQPLKENMENKTIVQIALADPNFSTLVTALKAAGLVELLSGKGPFTVFAPTNAAFAKIPQSQLDALLKDKAKLIEVLTYHVVPGKVLSNQVIGLANAKTAQGNLINFRTQNGKVFVNEAQVVKADIDASNGVIHVVDTVLLPK